MPLAREGRPIFLFLFTFDSAEIDVVVAGRSSVSLLDECGLKFLFDQRRSMRMMMTYHLSLTEVTFGCGNRQFESTYGCQTFQTLQIDFGRQQVL